MTDMVPAIDPVTLTVIWNSLVSITDKMGGALFQTRDAMLAASGLLDLRVG